MSPRPAGVRIHVGGEEGRFLAHQRATHSDTPDHTQLAGTCHDALLRETTARPGLRAVIISCERVGRSRELIST
jgi:hypothetical protein